MTSSTVRASWSPDPRVAGFAPALGCTQSSQEVRCQWNGARRSGGSVAEQAAGVVTPEHHTLPSLTTAQAELFNPAFTDVTPVASVVTGAGNDYGRRRRRPHMALDHDAPGELGRDDPFSWLGPTNTSPAHLPMRPACLHKDGRAVPGARTTSHPGAPEGQPDASLCAACRRPVSGSSGDAKVYVGHEEIVLCSSCFARHPSRDVWRAPTYTGPQSRRMLRDGDFARATGGARGRTVG